MNDTSTGTVAIGSELSSGTDKFVILCKLGRGGMGTVFKAQQVGVDRMVAVKILHQRSSAENVILQRFVREAKAVAAIDSPFVVKVFGFGIHEHQPYIVMEYVEGETLSTAIKRDTRLSADQCYPIFEQLLDGLGAIHEAGFVHRDIKPANIMITANGITKLMDFGIAKELPSEQQQAQRITQTGTTVGSPWYMSPEQCGSKPVDARSDIYSVGCTLFEALSGEVPFAGENPLQVMFSHVHDELQTTGKIEDALLADVLRQAMAKQKDDRFSRTDQFKRALIECRKGTYNAPTRQRTAAPAPSRRKLQIALFLGFAATAIALLIFYFTNKGTESTVATKPLMDPDLCQRRFKTEVRPRIRTLSDQAAKARNAAEKAAVLAPTIDLLNEGIACLGPADAALKCEMLCSLGRLYWCYDQPLTDKTFERATEAADIAYGRPQWLAERIQVYKHSLTYCKDKELFDARFRKACALPSFANPKDNWVSVRFGEVLIQKGFREQDEKNFAAAERFLRDGIRKCEAFGPMRNVTPDELLARCRLVGWLRRQQHPDWKQIAELSDASRELCAQSTEDVNYSNFRKRNFASYSAEAYAKLGNIKSCQANWREVECIYQAYPNEYPPAEQARHRKLHEELLTEAKGI